MASSKGNRDRPLVASKPPTLPLILSIMNTVDMETIRIIRALTDLLCSLQRNLGPHVVIPFLAA